MYDLWPHQQSAESLLMGGSAILWHEMRLGKTRSALHAYNQLLNSGEVHDLVVVTVGSAKATWRQEIEAMGLSLPSYLCYGQSRQELKPVLTEWPLPRVFILNWEILPQWQRWLYMATVKGKRKFCLVLDEGHLFLRNPNNQRYKAAQWLSRFAHRTWELTGTLMVKSGLDIYHQAKFLGYDNPFRWMDAEEFGSEYCHRRFNPFMGVKGGWEYTSLKNEQHLLAKLPQVSVLRMDDVADIPLPQQLPRWVDDLGSKWDYYRSDTTLAKELNALIPKKIKLAAEYVHELPQRPVVVFGWNVEFTQGVAKLLKAPLVRGGTSMDERERLRQDFQGGKYPILVGNLRSLGLGISLSHCDHFVHGQPWYDASLYRQADARGRDLRKRRPITSHHLLLAGSAEEYVWKRRLDYGRSIDRLYDASADINKIPDEEYA